MDLSEIRPPILGQSGGVEAAIRSYNDSVSRQLNNWENIENDCDKDAQEVLQMFFRSMKRKAKDRASDYTRRVYEHDRHIRQLKYRKLQQENARDGLPPPPQMPEYMSSNQPPPTGGDEGGVAYGNGSDGSTPPESDNELIKKIARLHNELERLSNEGGELSIEELKDKYPSLVIGDASNVLGVINNTTLRMEELEKKIHMQNKTLQDIMDKEDRIMQILGDQNTTDPVVMDSLKKIYDTLLFFDSNNLPELMRYIHEISIRLSNELAIARSHDGEWEDFNVHHNGGDDDDDDHPSALGVLRGIPVTVPIISKDVSISEEDHRIAYELIANEVSGLPEGQELQKLGENRIDFEKQLLEKITETSHMLQTQTERLEAIEEMTGKISSELSSLHEEKQKHYSNIDKIFKDIKYDLRTITSGVEDKQCLDILRKNIDDLKTLYSTANAATQEQMQQFSKNLIEHGELIARNAGNHEAIQKLAMVSARDLLEEVIADNTIILRKEHLEVMNKLKIMERATEAQIASHNTDDISIFERNLQDIKKQMGEQSDKLRTLLIAEGEKTRSALLGLEANTQKIIQSSAEGVLKKIGNGLDEQFLAKKITDKLSTEFDKYTKKALALQLTSNDESLAIVKKEQEEAHTALVSSVKGILEDTTTYANELKASTISSVGEIIQTQKKYISNELEHISRVAGDLNVAKNKLLENNTADIVRSVLGDFYHKINGVFTGIFAKIDELDIEKIIPKLDKYYNDTMVEIENLRSKMPANEHSKLERKFTSFHREQLAQIRRLSQTVEHESNKTSEGIQNALQSSNIDMVRQINAKIESGNKAVANSISQYIEKECGLEVLNGNFDQLKHSLNSIIGENRMVKTHLSAMENTILQTINSSGSMTSEMLENAIASMKHTAVEFRNEVEQDRAIKNKDSVIEHINAFVETQDNLTSSLIGMSKNIENISQVLVNVDARQGNSDQQIAKLLTMVDLLPQHNRNELVPVIKNMLEDKSQLTVDEMVDTEEMEVTHPVPIDTEKLAQAVVVGVQTHLGGVFTQMVHNDGALLAHVEELSNKLNGVSNSLVNAVKQTGEQAIVIADNVLRTQIAHQNEEKTASDSRFMRIIQEHHEHLMMTNEKMDKALESVLSVSNTDHVHEMVQQLGIQEPLASIEKTREMLSSASNLDVEVNGLNALEYRRECSALEMLLANSGEKLLQLAIPSTVYKENEEQSQTLQEYSAKLEYIHKYIAYLIQPLINRGDREIFGGNMALIDNLKMVKKQLANLNKSSNYEEFKENLKLVDRTFEVLGTNIDKLHSDIGEYIRANEEKIHEKDETLTNIEKELISRKTTASLLDTINKKEVAAIMNTPYKNVEKKKEQIEEVNKKIDEIITDTISSKQVVSIKRIYDTLREDTRKSYWWLGEEEIKQCIMNKMKKEFEEAARRSTFNFNLDSEKENNLNILFEKLGYTKEQGMKYLENMSKTASLGGGSKNEFTFADYLRGLKKYQINGDLHETIRASLLIFNIVN